MITLWFLSLAWFAVSGNSNFRASSFKSQDMCVLQLSCNFHSLTGRGLNITDLDMHGGNGGDFVKTRPGECTAVKEYLSTIDCGFVEINLDAQIQNTFKQASGRYVTPSPRTEDDWYFTGYGINEALGHDYALDEHHSLEEVNDWLLNVVSQHENVSVVESIGQSGGGREIYQATIEADNLSETLFFVECGIHAREWISVTFCQFLLYEILWGHYQHLRAERKWIFIMVNNPDGYDYTWTTNPLWRKNRVTNAGSTCPGVDLNRNHQYLWIAKPEAGAADPCTDVYAGPSVESEVETQLKRDFLADKWEHMDLYMSVHSAFDVIFVPPGWPKDKRYEQQDDLDLLAKSMAFTIKNSDYDSGAAHDGAKYRKFRYKTEMMKAQYNWYASGCADDWALFKGAKYAYTYELPPRDVDMFATESVFFVPNDMILPIQNRYTKGMEVAYDFIVEGTRYDLTESDAISVSAFTSLIGFCLFYSVLYRI